MQGAGCKEDERTLHAQKHYLRSSTEENTKDRDKSPRTTYDVGEQFNDDFSRSNNTKENTK
jgi:hypothetical protein